MANKTGHRRFGSVRRRRSGRWQARYQGPDGLTRSAPRTFDSKRSAEQWLTLMEGRILRGEWQPPEQSKIMFGGYATHWVADRRLEPRSRELYAMLLRLHIMPWFGDLALDRHYAPDGALVAHRSSTSGSFGINRGEVLPRAASDLEHSGEG